MARATMAILALMVLLINGAVATRMVVYSGEYYTGATAIISACGCTNIPYHGSFRYYAEGQSTRLYNEPDCRGAAHTVFPGNKNWQRNIGFGWNSAFIDLSFIQLVQLSILCDHSVPSELISVGHFVKQLAGFINSS
ncbi:hypothetical protein Sjap_005490 [Stephania japonica]|uniref:Uncharacterized protein n=1 Tax=Stephania japonica TaxID=461633 RepID=A0AAP0K476_9MAGN